MDARKPRLLVLNGTCLDVVRENGFWLDAIHAVEIVTDDKFRALTPENADQLVGDAAGLILPASFRSFPHAEHMARHPNLRVLSIAASGFDWLDIAAATRHNIVVTYSPVREGAEVVADMTWGLMLAVARQIPHHDRAMRSGPYERGVGVSLWRKTLGVVGLGNIGQAVVRRAAGFEMKVLAATPRPHESFVRRHGVAVVPLDDLMARSDFVSLHVRLKPETRGMISARELALMKPTAFLINSARQELVDEPALTQAVLERRIAGVAMDDPPTDRSSPLLKLPNFVCAPHLGNRAIEGMNAVFRSAVEQAVAVLRGGRPEHVLNPEVYDSRPSTSRP